jgi:hypothetical protein
MKGRKQLRSEQDARLRAAEAAHDRVTEQGEKVDRQLSLVGKLSEGWNRVHEFNHLAELFQPKGTQ